MKLKTPTYFAPLNFFGAGGCFGSADSPDGAVKNVCKEGRNLAKAVGGFREGFELTLSVYSIRDGCYGYWDDRGVFEVDSETDEIVAYAEVAYRYEAVNPRKPLTSCRLGKVEDCYVAGGLDRLREINAAGEAPIGTKV